MSLSLARTLHLVAIHQLRSLHVRRGGEPSCEPLRFMSYYHAVWDYHRGSEDRRQCRWQEQESCKSLSSHSGRGHGDKFLDFRFSFAYHCPSEQLIHQTEDVMTISEALLPEFDKEISKTRKTLDRIPEKADFVPHPKSMPLGSWRPTWLSLAALASWCLLPPSWTFPRAAISHCLSNQRPNCQGIRRGRGQGPPGAHRHTRRSLEGELDPRFRG